MPRVSPPRPAPRPARITLRARLYRVAQVRWVDLPVHRLAGLDLARGETKGWHALLRFNDDLDRVTLLPGKPGCFKLAFKVELLRAAGVDAGDTIEFTLEPDRESREPELPAEMARTFAGRPELAVLWAGQSVARRCQVVRYIQQARSPDAQARRCWIFLDRLAATGSLRDREKA